MNWYYAEGQEQKGPFSEDEFQALVRQGTVKEDTLVWHEGLGEWQAYASLAGGSGAPTESSGGGDAACAVCGKLLPVHELVQFEGAHVCAACKPVFLQKLREDATVPLQMNYAGFWIRFAAVFLDGLLLSIPYYALYFGTIAALSRSNPEMMSAIQIALSLLQMVVGLLYEVIMIGKYGATLGKMAVKIKVVTAEGGPVSYGRATGRYFAKILSQLILMIGYIMAGFDKEKRALHDMICNTRVIKRS